MIPDRILLIINRHSRSGQIDLDAVQARLRHAGFTVEMVFPSNKQSITEIIYNYRHNCGRIIIGGGDGTLNAAAEALLASALPIGILPLGTANDLARTLGIPPDPIAACEVIIEGRLHRIDLGCVNSHYFFNVAHIGFGVTLVHRLSADIKKRWGILGYARSAFTALRDRSSFRAEIRTNGRKHKTRCSQITVGNGRHFGGGLAVAHNARIDDHTLHVWSLEPLNLWELIALAPALLRGRHLEHRRVWHRRVQSIEVHTRKPMPVSADGELATHTPAKFHLLPSALAVYVPKSYETAAAAHSEGVGT